MLEELTQATLAPGFYRDNEKAQSVLRRRTQVEQKLDLARVGRPRDQPDRHPPTLARGRDAL